ncbi:RING-H2 finger protein ATL74-like [Olea europaea var. sylvestris]|uniref:RING-type E3 ubiquitin transferase n=1 Tax=Olea europaea subsp. europaea TaxID=158383 RepID=A0A8S0PXQ8_OLEEU|nr:RING-H2 finger protein ATL74-like [Olea europaea var. sylvestris]CAA2959443.1 Hypothetical predicted protein [Olea europaea subsp. europaea]
MNRNTLFRVLLDTDTSILTSNIKKTGSTSSKYGSDVNLDSNLVMILAALLCALGLNSIVSCLIRCSQRFGVETAAEAAAASTGLKKETLGRIPLVVYKSRLLPICIGEFRVRELKNIAKNRQTFC